ncbi:MAG: hypothetical protein VKN33_03535 [Candidatus Sericytochromatia bacterium]|nr:hypothetical protein [Candidatus Sericytochromatia bacterium]
MSGFQGLGHHGDKAQIIVRDENSPVTVAFIGRIDDVDPGSFMDPALQSIHDQILAAGLSEIAADFTELTFLNSSGIKSLIKWIMRQTELDDDQKYKIKLLYSSRVTWQQTSLKALTFLAPKTVSTVPA